MEFSLARQQFYQDIQPPDAQIDLASAALHIAQEEYPELEPAIYLRQLDAIASAIAGQLPAERYPLRVIQTINRYLFEELGFTGNTTDYYNPRNSFLNDVLERRTGIPITLSLVYMEVARRLDFPMEGVGMPGHFLIRPQVGDMEVCVDPFHAGEVLFPEDCQARLQQVFGKPMEWRPDFLQAITARQFLARMLSNLKMIYLQQNDAVKALAAIERILLLMPDAPLEQRDRGLLYYQLGRWREASYDLESYLNATPAAQDRQIVQQLLKRIQDQNL